MSESSGLGAALLRVGVGIVERSAGSSIGRIVNWLTGKTVLIVGQQRSGKSTFRDYLRYGLLDDEKPTEKTYEVTKTGAFRVSMGRDKELQLVIRSAKELPGQYGPVAHANLVSQYRPHAILILSDLTANLTGPPEKAAGAWLEEFCRRLEKLARSGQAGTSRLRSIILVLNKKDKVDDRAAAKREKALRKILEKELQQALGKITAPVAILPCISVNSSQGPSLIDRVIIHLAKSLAEGS